jgi:hypothetical protein
VGLELARVTNLPSLHGSIVSVLLLATLMCRLAHPNGKSASNHIVVDLPQPLTSLETDLVMGGDLNCILSSEHSIGTRILAQPLPWPYNASNLYMSGQRQLRRRQSHI